MRQNRSTLPTGQQRESFIELSTRLASFVQAEGGAATPFHDPALPHFSSLDPLHQDFILQQLSTYVFVCEEVKRSGFSVRDARALTWRMLKHLNLTPLGDAFEMIGSEDLVEIYNERHVQCFASLNFLEYVTYTLEDLYCRPWMELYSRDEEIARRIYSSLQLMIEGQIEGTLLLDIPSHLVRETCSVGRRSAVVRPKIFSPVSERGRRSGFITVNEMVQAIPVHS